jgi:hypothetical protein
MYKQSALVVAMLLSASSAVKLSDSKPTVN